MFARGLCDRLLWRHVCAFVRGSCCVTAALLQSDRLLRTSYASLPTAMNRQRSLPLFRRYAGRRCAFFRECVPVVLSSAPAAKLPQHLSHKLNIDTRNKLLTRGLRVSGSVVRLAAPQ